MIIIRGESYCTAIDAALDLGVSTKTLRQYISKGIIPPPPEMEYGVRVLKHFPPDYMQTVKKRLAIYREKSERSKPAVR